MFDEDLDVLFDEDEHAVAAVYDGATPVLVIFDNPYVEQFDVAGTNPTALGKASDFPVAGAPVGKTLLIGSVTYTIRDREPVDDGALVRLQLSAP